MVEELSSNSNFKTFKIVSAGCKTNFAESAEIERNLIGEGFKLSEEAPSFVIINTCAVTSAAESDMQKIIKKEILYNPQATVIVTGCYAQFKGEIIKKIFPKCVVIGNNEKLEIPKMLANTSQDLRNFSFGGFSYENGKVKIFKRNYGIASWGASQRTRYFVKIQDGCDYFCSYCIIPFLRGKPQSVPISSIVKIVEKILKEGGKEIVLTGINIALYGRDIQTSLLGLLKELRFLGVPRLRISSLEPDKVSLELIEFIAENKWVMPHFHLPLQSGSNKILKLMRRPYTREHYESVVYNILNYISDCAIGADVLTGFPGETEEDFQDTYAFLNDLPVAYLHVFTYSEREGTSAARNPNQVPLYERKKRTRLLRELSFKKQRNFYKKWLGVTYEVLFEERDKDGYWVGWSPNYIKTKVWAPDSLRNVIKKVRLTCLLEDQNVVKGEIFEPYCCENL